MGLYFKNGDVAYLTTYLGGDERIRTAGAAFAEPCLTTWRRRLEWERETGIEPVTFSLARRCSTTEPLPRVTQWAVRDSNSHGLRQRILSPPCLPISATARNAL